MATHPPPYKIFEPDGSSKVQLPPLPADASINHPHQHTHLNTTPASSIYSLYSLPSSNPSPISDSPPFPYPEPAPPRDPYTTPPSAAYTLPAPPAAIPRAVGPADVRYPRSVATAAGGSRYMHLREEEDGNGDGDGDRWTWRTEGRICKNGRSTVLAVPVPKLKPVVDVVVAEYQGLRLCAVSDAVPWLLSPLSLPIRLQAILEDGPRFPAPLCHPAHRHTHTRRDKALLALLTALEGRRERGNWYAQGLAIRGGRLVLYRGGRGDGDGDGKGGKGVEPVNVDSGVFGMWAEKLAGRKTGEEGGGDVKMGAIGKEWKHVVSELCVKPSGSDNDGSSGPHHSQHSQHVRPEDTHGTHDPQVLRPERSMWSRETPARTEEGRPDTYETAQARWCTGMKSTTETCLLWSFVGFVCVIVIGGIVWGFMGVVGRRE
ncbi:hypothetical protein PTTW11_03536 [Pyrenophora teres f. teres]|uniref:Uncharacterized protein n=1 Tax=Pyrenophora teres f. teres TaxID=97479 RepID=A0A6S6VWW9_9PLEO|nr:hypothetical protein PTTW11_03536 [Pyrenophora teres f. teres]